MNTADIEREKALKNRPTEESGSILNTQTQDPARFGEGENIESSYDPYAPKPNFLQKVVGGVKDKVGNWVDNQRAKAIENATPPEVTAQGGETLSSADQKGLAANQTIQNAEIPNWKRMTFNDILFNPEYEPIRDSIASEAVRARAANLAAGLAGKQGGYTSAIDKYNNQQAQRYSDAVADRDTRALEAQLQADEAANKRDVGAELQRADTYLGRELDRWGLLYDTETKKKVLDQMVQDSKEFAKALPNPEDRLMLTAYQQYLSGDATALDSIISTYGTQALDKLSDLVDWVKTLAGGDTTPKPSIKIGDTEFTQDQLSGMKWDTLDKYIQGEPLDEQKRIIEEYEKAGYKNADKLRKNYETRAKNDTLTTQWNEEQVKNADAKADYIDSAINTILNSNYDEKQKRDILKEEQERLQSIERGGKFVDTEKMKAARARLKQEIAKADIAVEVTSINKPLQNNVNLELDKNGYLDTKQADASLSYLAKLDWNKLINKNTQSVTDRKQKLEAVMGTQGYKDVVDYLKNPKVMAYAYKGGASNYKYAVQKFCDTFGGTPADYGFLNVTW